MFTALISTFITSISDIFWKKSLNYKVGGKVHDLLSYPVGILVIIYLFFTDLDFGNTDYIIIISSLIILVISVFKTQLVQTLYRDEKISVIIPYTNINKVLTIIASFFIFADVSKTSLSISILAIFVIIGFSINLKTLKFPKKLGKIVFIELISASTFLWSGYLILNYGAELYFILFCLSGVFVLSILSFFLGQFKSIKGLPKDFRISRAIGGTGWFSWFLSLMVIKELGLSISILLSFLGLGFTLLMSYFFLKDIPSKKSLLLTIIVTALVGIGYYFK